MRATEVIVERTDAKVHRSVIKLLRRLEEGALVLEADASQPSGSHVRYVVCLTDSRPQSYGRRLRHNVVMYCPGDVLLTDARR